MTLSISEALKLTEPIICEFFIWCELGDGIEYSINTVDGTFHGIPRFKLFLTNNEWGGKHNCELNELLSKMENYLKATAIRMRTSGGNRHIGYLIEHSKNIDCSEYYD